MQTIPLRSTANQALQVVLDGQNCSLRIYTRTASESGDGLFCDLDKDQQAVFYGVRCLDGLTLPLYDYLGFLGKLVFVDMQGAEPPHWSGLGTRWQLVYLSPDEAGRYEAGTL